MKIDVGGILQIVDERFPLMPHAKLAYKNRLAWRLFCLERDSKDSTETTNFWKFTKFDNLNRPIMSGIMTGLGSYARQTLQTAFDSFSGQEYETFSSSGLRGYTNVSFPSAFALAGVPFEKKPPHAVVVCFHQRHMRQHLGQKMINSQKLKGR
jgi:hypothetical protein